MALFGGKRELWSQFLQWRSRITALLGVQGHRSVDLDFVPNRHKKIKKMLKKCGGKRARWHIYIYMLWREFGPISGFIRESLVPLMCPDSLLWRFDLCLSWFRACFRDLQLVRWNLFFGPFGGDVWWVYTRQTTILENLPLKRSVFCVFGYIGGVRGGGSWGIFGTLRFPVGGCLGCSPNHLFRRLNLWILPPSQHAKKRCFFRQPGFPSFVFQYFAFV